MDAKDDSAPPPCVLDRDALVERLGGDEALAGELLREFVDDARGDLERIAAALDARDWAEAVRESHSVAGVSANLGAAGMKSAALALCAAARKECAGEAGAGLRRLGAELDSLREIVARRGVTASACRAGS